MPLREIQDHVALVNWVHDSLARKKRSDICEILHGIADAVGAYGVILWEVDKDIPLEDPSARLFTAGHWFRSGKHFATHNLHVMGSLAGRVIVQNLTEWTNQINIFGAKTAEAKEFYELHEIQGCLCIKVSFEDGTLGSVTLYRQACERQFNKEDELHLQEYCKLLPGIHDALHHRVSFELECAT